MIESVDHIQHELLNVSLNKYIYFGKFEILILGMVYIRAVDRSHNIQGNQNCRVLT